MHPDVVAGKAAARHMATLDLIGLDVCFSV